jgi:hypothetical protein
MGTLPFNIKLKLDLIVNNPLNQNHEAGSGHAAYTNRVGHIYFLAGCKQQPTACLWITQPQKFKAF